MTTTDFTVRMDFDAHASRYSKVLGSLDTAAQHGPLDKPLRELVRMRASQLNGCAYCVDMHSKDARAGGESEQRLYALSVWRETPFFTAAERAALALTEAITRLGAEQEVPDEVWNEAAAQFDEPALAQLVAIIVTINAWNLISVTTHAWTPGTYQP